MQATQTIRTLQAVGSKTFSLPSGFLDATIPLPTVWDHHMEHSPNHPLFVFEDGPGEICTITWSEAVRAIHRAGRMVQSYAKENRLLLDDAAKPAVIGLLAVKGTALF